MNIKITGKFKEICPELTLGIITANVKVSDSGDELIQELKSTYDSCKNSLDREDIAKQPNIQGVRKFYKKCGKDPARYRPASEALIRRAVLDKGLGSVNNIVDINNIVSMQSHFPVCAYNLDKIEGDIEFRIGTSEEEYKCIGGSELNIDKLPVFSDSVSAFGSPTRDSLRTMVEESTQNLLFIVVSFTGEEDLNEYMNVSKELLERYALATDVEVEIQ